MRNTDIEHLQQHIIEVMRSIRNVTRPLNPGPAGLAKGMERWEGNLAGRKTERMIIYLRSSGCAWAMDESVPYRMKAGCLDCEHSVADTTYGVPISAELYLRQFAEKYHSWNFERTPILCLYNEGSFFNEKELPAHARREMLRTIATNGSIKRLVLESLPAYISDEVLEETVRILGTGNVELEIGVGLESSSDNIRRLCINKPYTLKTFDAVTQRIRSHCRMLAYVMIKPCFLTEKEALDDAISTTAYAFDAGAHAVSLEPVSIGTYTMSGALRRLDLYKPAWLWTVLAVGKKAAARGEVRIGGYQFAPNYADHPCNCRLCTPRIKATIRDYNGTYNPALLDPPTCVCVEDWQRELALEHPPLEQRIPAMLDQVRSHIKPELFGIRS